MATTSVLGRGALLGIATFALAVVALHLLQPELDPRDEAVSYYVHGRFGWVLTVGLLALGAASLALVVALARIARGARAGLWLLGVWAVGAMLGGVFEADPRGRWDQPPSIAGMIHGSAALFAFVALPTAALALRRPLRSQAEWRGSASLLTALGIGAAVSLVLFAGSLAPVFVRPGPPLLLGLTERVLLASYSAWLAVVALGMVPRSPRSASG
jgi:hypothetical protein